jgi:hypothetical protein
MLAFEIYINGVNRFTVGGDEYQSLNVWFGLNRLPLSKPNDADIGFIASAANPNKDRIASWPSLDVAIGDRVEIRAVDVESVDSPESVRKLE